MFIALAIRFALQFGLPDAVQRLTANLPSNKEVGDEEKQLYRLARVWFGICNLELL